jgi:NAD(P)-dependent dehydrogenase (short-subunit alcohol dehydrogenase family)
MLAANGIKVNTVAPGPIWTALIPSTIAIMNSFVRSFRSRKPMRYADNLAKRQEHSIGHICFPCCRTRRHQGERLCSVVLFYPQRRRGIE